MNPNNNIITFPKENIRYQNLHATSIEELRDEMDAIKEMFLDDTSENILSFLFDTFHNYGFSLDEDENNLKDISLVFHAIKSVLYKKHNFYYPLQSHVDNLVKEDAEGALIINDNC